MASGAAKILESVQGEWREERGLQPRREKESAGFGLGEFLESERREKIAVIEKEEATGMARERRYTKIAVYLFCKTKGRG